MKSRPIIFDGESVRAILAGRKTQSRRVVKPQLVATAHPRGECLHWHRDDGKLIPNGPRRAGGGAAVTATDLIGEYCPYGAPGDELWVREAFCQRWNDPPTPNGYWDGYWYAATDPQPVRVDGDGWTVFRKNGEEASPWKSPMFMPRWASRLTLRVTDVRVERVQEISEADAIAEGCKPVVWSDPPWWQGYREFDGDLLHQQVRGEQPPDWMIEPHKMKPNTRLDTSARLMFAGRWDAINAKRGFSWGSNPWVWVVAFERIDL